MEFNNWKSFLSKSILAPLMVITILLYRRFLFVEESDLTALIFGGLIFGYGLIIVAMKIFKKDKYNYLLIYGLLYALIGSVSIFFFPLYMESFDIFLYVISVIFLIHAFAKVFSRTLRNNFIRVLDIITGLIWIVLVVLSVYSIKTENGLISNLVEWAGIGLSGFEIILFIVRRIVYYKENSQILKELKIVEKATPKGKTALRNVDEPSYNKKKQKEGKVEVIDLERFFKV